MKSSTSRVNNVKNACFGRTSPRKRQSITTQKSGQRRRTFDAFDAALFSIAGADSPKVLINEWSNTRTGKAILLPVVEQNQSNKLKEVMKNLKSLHRNAPQNHKNVILSTVSKIFPRSELNGKYNLGVSAKSYTKARKIASTGPGKYFKKRQVNVNKLSDKKINEIRDFCYREDVSREAANRTIQIVDNGKKISVPVRYLHQSPQETYVHYISETEKGEDKISISCFTKYMPKEMKKPHRKTDMCPLCAKGKEIQATIKKLEAKTERDENDDNLLLQLKDELELINDHVKLEKKIRKEYNNQKEQLRNGEAIIIMDFKENMSLGSGAVETARDFYNTPHRSIFTIAVYTREGNDNERLCTRDGLKIHYFTFASDCLTHDTQFVFDCFRMMLNHEDWKSLNIKENRKINLWVDNAPQHFRTFQMLYEFKKLSEDHLKNNQLYLNYFAEYHGKCVCDSHFSLLSRYYTDKTKTLKHGTPVYSTPEFIDILQTAVEQTNEIKNQLNKKRKQSTAPYPLLHVTFFDYKRSDELQAIEQVTAPQFTSYYHFFFSKDFRLLCAKEHTNAKHTRNYPIKRKTVVQTKGPKLGWNKSRTLDSPVTVNALARKAKARASDRKNRTPIPSNNRRTQRRTARAQQNEGNTEPDVPASFLHDFDLNTNTLTTEYSEYPDLQDLASQLDELGIVAPPAPPVTDVPARVFIFEMYEPDGE